MQINFQDPNLLAALVKRLTAEIGETFVANCALDLIGDSHLAEIARLQEHNAALVARTTNDKTLIEGLRQTIADLQEARRADSEAIEDLRAKLEKRRPKSDLAG